MGPGNEVMQTFKACLVMLSFIIIPAQVQLVTYTFGGSCHANIAHVRFHSPMAILYPQEWHHVIHDIIIIETLLLITNNDITAYSYSCSIKEHS